MRIAVWHNLPSGGGKRALYYHVKGLVERGHTVEAWCPPTADRSFLPLSSIIRENVVPYPWHPRRLRNPVRRAWANYSNVLDKINALEEHCRKCARQIEQGGFDVLLANADRDFHVPPIARYAPIANVLYLQEPSRTLYEASPGLPWAAIPSPGRFSPGYAVRFVHDLIKVQAIRVQARQEQLNARAFGTILVNSFFSRESVRRAYGLDSRVCYLGVDTTLFKPLGRERQCLVVSVGALLPAKDPAFIIEAVSSIPEPRPKLTWVGNASLADYADEVFQLAAKLNVDLEIQLAVSDDYLVEALNRASVLAYAPRLEPFGYAPLEANACGTAVVAVAEGGVRETVEDGENGILVEHEPVAMGQAIARLLGDPQGLEQMGRRARQMAVERWSLPASIDRLESRLVQAIEEQGSRTDPAL